MAKLASSSPAGKVAEITVLAGVNGAGKSSIGGERLRAAGATYFNPDEETQKIIAVRPSIGSNEANSLAWMMGKEALEQAIAAGTKFNFETTLGGKSITTILLRAAADQRARVRMWYAGLDSPERHMKRVADRVASGGHDIPEEKVRERYASSHANVVTLIPHLNELRVYDNSEEADPKAGQVPKPRLVLAFTKDGITFPTQTTAASTPNWAKPLVMAAVKRFRALPR